MPHNANTRHKVGTHRLKPFMYRLYCAKPCPFCGSKKMFFGDGIDFNGQQVFWLYCSVCNCAGPQAVLQTDAVEAWNARRGEETSGYDMRYRVRKTPIPREDDRAVPQYMLHQDYNEVNTHRIPRRLRKSPTIPYELQYPYFDNGSQLNERDKGFRLRNEGVEQENKDE